MIHSKSLGLSQYPYLWSWPFESMCRDEYLYFVKHLHVKPFVTQLEVQLKTTDHCTIDYYKVQCILKKALTPDKCKGHNCGPICNTLLDQSNLRTKRGNAIL